jgi:hypothetical protein
MLGDSGHRTFFGEVLVINFARNTIRTAAYLRNQFEGIARVVHLKGRREAGVIGDGRSSDGAMDRAKNPLSSLNEKSEAHQSAYSCPLLLGAQ